MAKKRVHWDEEDLTKLANSFVLQRKSGLYRIAAFNAAQEAVLEPSRRRHIKAMTTINKDWETYVAKAEAALKAAPVPEPVIEQPTLTIEIALQFIIDHLADRTADIVIERLRRTPFVIGGQVDEPVATEPQQPRERRLTVVIAGMQEKQRNQLAAEFPTIKLKVIEKNTGSADITNIVNGADYVLGMTSFMSHALDGKIKALCKAKKNYTMVSGGMTQFRHRLRVIVATHKD